MCLFLAWPLHELNDHRPKMALRGAALKTHTYNADDPTGTVGAVHQTDSTSDVIEYNMQAGRTVLVQDVRTSFVPSGQRFLMEGQRHHMVSDQQIQLREQRRQEQRHGVQRQVLRDLHDRTHNHDGSLKTWHPTLVELLDRFPAESQDELILKDCNIGQMPKHMGILRHIRTVDLSSNKIREVSEGISEILGLQVLNLSNNQLVALPKTTKLLTNLRVLSEAAPKVRANPKVRATRSRVRLRESICPGSSCVSVTSGVLVQTRVQTT